MTDPPGPCRGTLPGPETPPEPPPQQQPSGPADKPDRGPGSGPGPSSCSPTPARASTCRHHPHPWPTLFLLLSQPWRLARIWLSMACTQSSRSSAVEASKSQDWPVRETTTNSKDSSCSGREEGPQFPCLEPSGGSFPQNPGPSSTAVPCHLRDFKARANVNSCTPEQLLVCSRPFSGRFV